MIPNAGELQRRTRKFFLRVLRVCEKLPKAPATSRIAEQLKESAGKADGHFRAACGGRSLHEFVRKAEAAAKDADQARRWLRTLHLVGFGNQAETRDLMHEAYALKRAFLDAVQIARGLLAKAPRLRAGNEGF